MSEISVSKWGRWETLRRYSQSLDVQAGRQAAEVVRHVVGFLVRRWLVTVGVGGAFRRRIRSLQMAIRVRLMWEDILSNRSVTQLNQIL